MPYSRVTGTSGYVSGTNGNSGFTHSTSSNETLDTYTSWGNISNGYWIGNGDGRETHTHTFSQDVAGARIDFNATNTAEGFTLVLDGVRLNMRDAIADGTVSFNGAGTYHANASGYITSIVEEYPLTATGTVTVNVPFQSLQVYHPVIAAGGTNGTVYNLYVDTDPAEVSDGIVQGADTGEMMGHGYTDEGGDQIGSGSDSIEAGGGNDSIYSGSGDDTVSGGAGNDYFSGGTGNDLLLGGTGNDSLIGGNGNDTLYGGDGADYLDGSAGDDYLSGDAGNDTLAATRGNDTLIGGSDADYFRITPGAFAGGEVVTVDGGTSGIDNDSLTLTSWDAYRNLTDTSDADGDSTSGSVEVMDSSGNWIRVEFTEIETLYLPATDLTSDDIVEGTGAGDLIDGSYSGDAEGDMVDEGDNLAGNDDDNIQAGAGSDTVHSGDGNDSVDAGSGDDLVYGDAGNDTVHGGIGNDTLYGYDDDDVLHGDGGNDWISGNSGLDTIYGGDGNDTLQGWADDDVVYGDAGNDSITGGAGSDSLYGGDDNDSLFGWADDDVLYGDGGNDSVSGGSGADTMYGGDGDDTLQGGADNDVLYGDAGDDLFYAGGGADSMYGGDGNDTLRGEINEVIDGGGDADNLVVLDRFDNLNVTGGETGTDEDTLSLTEIAGDITVTFSGDEAGTFTDGVDTGSFSEIEDIHLGGGDDNVDASASASDAEIVAGAGNDSVTGGAGADTLIGDTGADSLTGGAGADQIFGGADNDTINLAEGDYVDGGDGDDTFYVTDLGEAGTADVTIVGGEGDETQGDTLDFQGLTHWDNITITSEDSVAGDISGFATLDDGSRVNFSEIENIIICFTAGTRIATAHGLRPVEELQPGDLVLTRDNGLKPVCWAGQRTVPARGKLAPIRFATGAVNNDAPLLVSPQHRILITGAQPLLMFGTSEVLVPAKQLVNGDTVTQTPGGDVTYVHIMFDQHVVIYSEGAPTESFFPGGTGLDAVEQGAREELFTIFPELRSDLASYGDTARAVLKAHEGALITI